MTQYIKSTMFGIRDKANCLKHWFENESEAQEFIDKNDPDGAKGYHVITR